MWLGHTDVVGTHCRGWDTLPWSGHTALVGTHCRGRDALPNTLEMRGHDVGRVFFSVINRNDFEMTEKNEDILVTMSENIG